jgi:hypothetical protein
MTSLVERELDGEQSAGVKVLIVTFSRATRCEA